jgi:hypothetical protein
MNGLIVFLIPPEEVISGGIMSIFSLAQESRMLKDTHNSEVFISVYPGNDSYRKNALFANTETIYEFDALLDKYKEVDSLVIHIPEYAVKEVSAQLIERSNKFPPNVQINILNQNIVHMPNMDDISILYSVTNNITQTVAHKRYSSQDVADKYGLPTHLFGVYINESQYKKSNFSKKEKIILYSPDDHTQKNAIIETLQNELPDYEFLEIRNLTYDEYKMKIKNASYTITFGEGFDGYFIEPVFSGSISIAVYNDIFFPSKSYLKYPNVFTSYENLLESAVRFIKEQDKSSYNELNSTLAEELMKIYSRDIYVENIKLFYRKCYTHTPSLDSRLSLSNKAIKYMKTQIDNLRQEAYRKDLIISDKYTQIENLNLELLLITQSRAWKYITIMRKLLHFGK